MVKNFETVSLSHCTMISQNHVEGKLKQVMNDSNYFSLALDEGTNVMVVSQLLIFTRAIGSSFEVHKE